MRPGGALGKGTGSTASRAILTRLAELSDLGPPSVWLGWHRTNMGGPVPITARLSREFYDRLGDTVAHELVEWFNAVDTQYRQEFRDLFEAHFGRFEARLQQGLAELRSELRAEFKGDIARLEAKIEAQGPRLVLWSFGFWVANVVSVLTILKLAGVL